jgi:polyisoprenyl-teichoic acid--peptidoglycan teichoic acid transferase
MTPISSRPRHPWLAALLSFIVPGLGQAYLGQWPLGVVLAVPFFLALGMVAVLLTSGLESLGNVFFSTTFLVGVFALNAALLGWRLFAIAHAGMASTEPAMGAATPVEPIAWRTRGSQLILALLIVAAVGMHAYVAMVVMQLNTTLGQIFEDPAPPPAAPPDDEEEPVEEEPTYAWDGRERVNFLLVGVDEAPGREAALTDTILALSVDPAENSAVMVSIPRDTGSIPLPDTSIYAGARYPGKINGLASEAAANPALWCPAMTVLDEDDAQRCGIRSLQESVSLYLGIPIHYYARVDLLGFGRLIDAFGGVELCLPGRLVDPTYLDPVSGERGLDMPAGCAHYGGREALAYARSRQGYIEMPDGTREQQNDFLRADRQQQILLALRAQLDAGNILFDLPDVLDAIGNTVTTDFPRSQAGDLATLVPLVTGPDIERVVLGYPEFVDLPVDPRTNYILTPRRDAIRDEMERLFGQGELEGWYLATDADLPT